MKMMKKVLLFLFVDDDVVDDVDVDVNVLSSLHWGGLRDEEREPSACWASTAEP